MSHVSIQRIHGRAITKQTAFAASWEAFDDTGYLLGYIDDIGRHGVTTLTFNPTPELHGYTDSMLLRMAECMAMAKGERRKELDAEAQICKGYHDLVRECKSHIAQEVESHDNGHLHSHADKFARVDSGRAVVDPSPVVACD